MSHVRKDGYNRVLQYRRRVPSIRVFLRPLPVCQFKGNSGSTLWIPTRCSLYYQFVVFTDSANRGVIHRRSIPSFNREPPYLYLCTRFLRNPCHVNLQDVEVRLCLVSHQGGVDVVTWVRRSIQLRVTCPSDPRASFHVGFFRDPPYSMVITRERISRVRVRMVRPRANRQDIWYPRYPFVARF